MDWAAGIPVHGQFWWSRSVKHPDSQQVKLGAPKHLALEELQAIDMTFHWTGTPIERCPSFNGSRISAEACGQAAKGYQRAPGRSLHPRFQLLWLTVPQQLGKRERQRDGVRKGGVSLAQLAEERSITLSHVLWVPQDEPGRLARLIRKIQERHRSEIA